MDEIIPWGEWVDRIKMHYPSGERGCLMRGGTIMNAAIINAHDINWTVHL